MSQRSRFVFPLPTKNAFGRPSTPTPMLRLSLSLTLPFFFLLLVKSLCEIPPQCIDPPPSLPSSPSPLSLAPSLSSSSSSSSMSDCLSLLHEGDRWRDLSRAKGNDWNDLQTAHSAILHARGCFANSLRGLQNADPSPSPSSPSLSPSPSPPPEIHKYLSIATVASHATSHRIHEFEYTLKSVVPFFSWLSSQREGEGEGERGERGGEGRFGVSGFETVISYLDGSGCDVASTRSSVRSLLSSLSTPGRERVGFFVDRESSNVMAIEDLLIDLVTHGEVFVMEKVIESVPWETVRRLFLKGGEEQVWFDVGVTPSEWNLNFPSLPPSLSIFLSLSLSHLPRV